MRGEFAAAIGVQMASAHAGTRRIPPFSDCPHAPAARGSMPRIRLFGANAAAQRADTVKKSRDHAPKTEIRQFAGCKSRKIIVQ